MVDKLTVEDHRKHGFFIVYNELVRRDGKLLGPHAIAVYCLLASFADNDTHEAFPIVKTIANMLGISPTTVKKAIKILVKYKWIEKEDRKGPGGKNYHSNNYHLLDVPPAPSSPNDQPSSSGDQPSSPDDQPSSGDDQGGGSGDDHELDSYTDQDSKDQESLNLNPEEQDSPLPPANAGGATDGANGGDEQPEKTDGLFEFILKAVWGITYTKGMKLDGQTRGRANGIEGALQTVKATPVECAAALSWHIAGRDEKRTKMGKPTTASGWSTMIAAYRESDEFTVGDSEAATTARRSRFTSGKYADVIRS